jgi:hypothetical protein
LAEGKWSTALVAVHESMNALQNMEAFATEVVEQDECSLAEDSRMDEFLGTLLRSS